MTLRAKRCNSCLLREFRGPPCFLRVGILAFLGMTDPESGRTPMSLAPSCPTDGRPRAKEEPRDAELNQPASREPGEPSPGWDV
jgi:hypothetical protein